jgi:hypothetical protein
MAHSLLADAVVVPVSLWCVCHGSHSDRPARHAVRARDHEMATVPTVRHLRTIGACLTARVQSGT